MLKVRFDKINTANSIKEKGLRIFAFLITTRQIEHKKFIPIKQCMHCYSYDHVKNKCLNKEESCSECGEKGHIFTQCMSQTKKCLRCCGDHRTLAKRSPVRKRIIKETEAQKTEKEKEQERGRQTGSKTISATKETIRTTIMDATPQSQPIIQLPNDTSMEILTILINAYHTCLRDPNNDYNTVANRGLKTAGLPVVTFEPVRDIVNILRVIAPSAKNKLTSMARSQESVQSHIITLERHDRLLSQSEEEAKEDKNGELEIVLPDEPQEETSHDTPNEDTAEGESTETLTETTKKGRKSSQKAFMPPTTPTYLSEKQARNQESATADYKNYMMAPQANQRH
ncbi:uncharacterized protein LOC122265758 [Penaeus japonicus]|uniref:uncharacterized protein LOC122265758 n=1 Tax=Penaeus japonicus TaxID=27405 RepID=UPI001C70E511|nr:uncharacterized protein LOC122265758 [Penaeus japonicus]